VVGSTTSRSFRYSEFNPVSLGHQADPSYPPAPINPVAPPPNTSDEEKESKWSKVWCAIKTVFGGAVGASSCGTSGKGCIQNVTDSVKTGDWSEFKGISNFDNIIGCVGTFAIGIGILLGIALIFGVGGPILYPLLDAIKSLFGTAFGWGVEMIEWIAGTIWWAIMEVADFLGANHWLVALDLLTGLAWALAEVLQSSIGLWHKWSDSDFAVIYRFLDTPFELLVAAADAVGSWLGWIAWALLLPFEAGALIISFVVGGVWELIKMMWTGVLGTTS
jgi:hypothetical protein